MIEQHKSQCLLCSLGCGFIIETSFDEALNLEYDRENPVNRGTLCSKGNYALEFINHPLRLIEPRSGGKAITWINALSMIESKFFPDVGATSAGLILEGDSSSEDIMTAQLFNEKCLGNGRVAVHFATGDNRVYRTLAASNIPISPVRRDDIEKSGCIIAIGDPFEVGPAIAGGVLAAKYAKMGNTLTVVSKEPNATSRFATAHLGGSERKTLANLLRVVVDQSDGNDPKWKQIVKEMYPFPENPAVAKAGKAFVQTPSSVMILETQDPVIARLASAIMAASGTNKRLHYLCTYGNVSGICEVFTGNNTVESLLDAVNRGEIKTLMVLGADVFKGISEQEVKTLRERIDFLAVGASFENKTTNEADLILPTSLWLESEGTYNGKILKPVIDPPGGALPYGEILRQVASKMGVTLTPVSSEHVLGHEGLDSEVIWSHLKEIEVEATEPVFRSTTIRYADGSLTDNMSWIQLQKIDAW